MSSVTVANQTRFLLARRGRGRWLILLALLGLALVGGMVVPSPVAATAAGVASAAAQAGATVPSAKSARKQAFANWLQALRLEAIARGIGPKLFDEAFKGVAPDEKIHRLDKSQPELKATAEDYIAVRLTPRRIKRGQEAMAVHAALLTEISQRFGVEPQMIVALWGVETDYGNAQLNQNAVKALATLAFEGRRADYFRRELLNCLWIIQNRKISPSALKSSWAGALGQIQFMPSSYLERARSRDGRGPPEVWPDVWNNQGDIFASIANYLAQDGWRFGEGWGQEVEPPTSAKLLGQVGINRIKTVGEWRQLGVVALPGQENRGFDDDRVRASLIRARDGDGPYYLINDNFRQIMKWNRSKLFAIVAGRLADELATSGEQ